MASQEDPREYTCSGCDSRTSDGTACAICGFVFCDACFATKCEGCFSCEEKLCEPCRVKCRHCEETFCENGCGGELDSVLKCSKCQKIYCRGCGDDYGNLDGETPDDKFLCGDCVPPETVPCGDCGVLCSHSTESDGYPCALTCVICRKYICEDKCDTPCDKEECTLSCDNTFCRACLALHVASGHKSEQPSGGAGTA